MPGIAAGVRGRCKIGDVLAAEMCWDYGSGKFEMVAGKPSFSVAPHYLPLDVAVASQIKMLAKRGEKMGWIRDQWPGPKPDEAIQIRLGPIASGAAVVADEVKVKEIESQHRKLVGVDMEAYSVFYVAAEAPSPRPLPIVLKGVSDFADSEKGDSYQSYAAHNSAQTLRALVEDHLFA